MSKTMERINAMPGLFDARLPIRANLNTGAAGASAFPAPTSGSRMFSVSEAYEASDRGYGAETENQVVANKQAPGRYTHAATSGGQALPFRPSSSNCDRRILGESFGAHSRTCKAANYSASAGFLNSLATASEISSRA